jgi:hypothetical protein
MVMNILEMAGRLKESKRKALERHSLLNMPIILSEVINGEKWLIKEFINGSKEKIRQLE